MTRKGKVMILTGALAFAALVAGAAAAAGSDQGREADPTAGFAADVDEAPEKDAAEGPDTPITGPDLDRASQVALAFLGEGRVTETEIGDEESYYEVEVTLDDGRQVDVQLDESFHVVGTD